VRATAALTVLGRYGSHPAPGGACRGYLLDAGGGLGQVLIGCGSGVAGRLAYHLPAPADLAAVLLPDLRPDHAADLWSIGSMAATAAAAGTRRGLLLTYAYQDPPEHWLRLQRPGVLDVRRFSSADTVNTAGWRCTFTPAAHLWPGACLRAEAADGASLGLVGPGAVTDELVNLLGGVALLVVEAGGANTGFDEGLDGGMSPDAAAGLAKACGAGRLLLSHLDPGEPAAAVLAEAVALLPTAALALEGRTYAL